MIPIDEFDEIHPWDEPEPSELVRLRKEARLRKNFEGEGNTLNFKGQCFLYCMHDSLYFGVFALTNYSV